MPAKEWTAIFRSFAGAALSVLVAGAVSGIPAPMLVRLVVDRQVP